MISTLRPARHRAALLTGLLLTSALSAGCGGGPDPQAQQEAEAKAAFDLGQKRHDYFMAIMKSPPDFGPTESHLVSWTRLMEGSIREMYDLTAPLRTSGLFSLSFRNALNESAMHARLADVTLEKVEARGGGKSNQNALAAAENSAWEAMRAANEVVNYAIADPSQANAAEVVEAKATVAALKEKWPRVIYDPERNFVPLGPGQ